MAYATRRTFLKSAAGAALAPTLLSSRTHAAGSHAAGIPTPTPAQQRWQECEIGVIYHLDMPTVAGNLVANNATQKTYDPQLYNPAKIDKLKQQIYEVIYTAEERHLMEIGRSNGSYHYLGSAKTYSQIGEAFAKALIDLEP
jgi:hypothetical protein